MGLFTDEPYFQTVMPYLFSNYVVEAIPTTQLISTLNIPNRYSSFVICLPWLTKMDWNLLEMAQSSFSRDIHVMVSRKILREEYLRIRKLGIKDVLLDPLTRIRTKGTYSELIYIPESNFTADNSPGIDIGCRTLYNHMQQSIIHDGTFVPLSNRESEVLQLFIDHEGEILTKDFIAKKLWNGHVAVRGIPKLIARLRIKLGSAGTLISGRKQGGYIYHRNHNPLDLPSNC